jgi:hypothetical protein
MQQHDMLKMHNIHLNVDVLTTRTCSIYFRTLIIFIWYAVNANTTQAAAPAAEQGFSNDQLVFELP